MSSDLSNAVIPLLKTIRNDRGGPRITALIELNLKCKEDKDKIALTSAELGTLIVLKEVIETNSGDARAKALECLWNLSLNPLTRSPSSFT